MYCMIGHVRCDVLLPFSLIFSRPTHRFVLTDSSRLAGFCYFILFCICLVPCVLHVGCACFCVFLSVQTREEFETLISPMGLDKVDKGPQEVPDNGDPSRFMDVS